METKAESQFPYITVLDCTLLQKALKSSQQSEHSGSKIQSSWASRQQVSFPSFVFAPSVNDKLIFCPGNGLRDGTPIICIVPE